MEGLTPFDERETVAVPDTTATFRFDPARMAFLGSVDLPGAVGPSTGGARARDQSRSVISTRFTSPTTKRYESAPMIATTAMYARA